VINETKLAALITTHIERYPEMEILDVYKLCHQAVFGPGQVIKNQKAAREWLERESELLRPTADQVLVEKVHPEGTLVRLNLRPYLAEQGSLAQLLIAYTDSSRSVEGSPDAMQANWSSVQAMIQNGNFRFDPRTTALIGRVRAAENWSNSHHSPAYNYYYKPAYRVIFREQAEALLKRQGIPYQIV
jgi:hypothetical protein